MSVDQYEVGRVLSSFGKTIEDLNYRVYNLEDALANINAYIEEHKEESEDA